MVALLVVVGIYGLALWVGFRWARMRLERRAREVAAAVEASGIRLVSSQVAREGRWRARIDVGEGATIAVRQWGRDSHLVSFCLAEPALPPIWIRRERGFDRVAKALGFEREVQLGDADFDQAHYIASGASDELVRSTLAGAETRRLIGEIVAQGLVVTLSREGVSASKLQMMLTRFDGSVVPGLLDKLRQLAAALPRTTTVEPFRQPLPTAAILVSALLLMFLPMLLAVVGMRGVLHPPVDDRMVLAAILAGIVPWALVVTLVARRLRSRPMAILEVPAVALSLLVCVPFAFAFGLFYVNSRWDGGAPTQHQVRVVDYYRKNHHTVYVAPWDESGARQKVIVPDSIARVAVGDALEVESRPGALGWTWVSNVRSR